MDVCIEIQSISRGSKPADFFDQILELEQVFTQGSQVCPDQHEVSSLNLAKVTFLREEVMAVALCSPFAIDKTKRTTVGGQVNHAPPLRPATSFSVPYRTMSIQTPLTAEFPELSHLTCILR